MKALVYTDVETLTWRDMPDPSAAAGEVLVRTAYSGICGSDMHAYLGHDSRRPAPLILGREVSGIITDGPRDGQRVTINPLVTCGICRDCATGRTNLCATRQIISMPPREGGFAEMLAIPVQNTVWVPDGFALEKATLAEPIACGWHAVHLGQAALGQTLKGMRCLVMGGGAIGVGAALSLIAQGADDVDLIETNPLRRERVREIAGFATYDAGTTDTPDNSYDIVIDGVGYAATRAAACALARPGGVIVHIGRGDSNGGLDIRRMTLQEITFIGTYTYTAQDFIDTAQAMFDGRLGLLDWAETRPLADGQAAFDDIRNGRIAAPKIILTP